MKKLFSLCFTAFCLILFLTALASCGKNAEKTTATACAVTFDAQGGTAMPTQTVERGSKATKPADPVKAGYTFNGWTYQGEDWSFAGYVVTEDMTLTAKWTPNTYTISFKANGGDAVEPLTVTYDAAYALPRATRTGYTFTGWYDGETKIMNGTWQTTENVTLTAHWNVNTYSITYDLGGGTNAPGNPSHYTYGESITLAAPTRYGHVFAGWTNGGQITPDTVGDQTFKAKWESKTNLVSTADPTFDYYHSDLSAYLTLTREDYSAITVSLDVTDKELDDYIRDHLLPSYRTEVTVTNRPVKDGDKVYIYYTGYVDGVAFEGGSNADDDSPAALVIGSGSFISGFEDQLIGVYPSNTSKDNPHKVNVTFPANYNNEELAGKAATFDVEIVSIFEGYDIPELTEDFVRNKVNNFEAKTDDPIGEFREAVLEWMRETKANNLDNRKFLCTVDQLLNSVAFTGVLPEGEVDRTYSQMTDAVTSAYQQYNIYYYMYYGYVPFDSLAECAVWYYGLRFDADWEEYQSEAAFKTVQQMLIMGRIAQIEGIEITEDEAKDWIREQARSTESDFESVLEVYSLEEVYSQVAARKVKEFLLSNVTFDYGELPIEDSAEED